MGAFCVALFERGRADDFRRKPLKYSFTTMVPSIVVKEVFAELFSKSDRHPFQKEGALCNNSI